MSSSLRQICAEDLPLVLSWRNAVDVRNNMYTNHVITEAEHRSWWEVQNINPATRLLMFEIDGQPAGVITFSQYTGENGTATWAFYSGDRSRRGVGGMMELAALEYAFETLRVRKLECEVLAFNSAVINFHLKHGFNIEGVFRQGYQRDGEYFDIYRLAMLAGEWAKYVKPALSAEANSDNKLVGREIISALDLSEATVDGYAEATGDRNPLHSDGKFAKAMGFDGRIAHGMLVGGELSRIFASEFPGPGTVYVSQSMEFNAPLLVGQPAHVRLKVIQQIGRRLQIETQAVQNDKICMTGLAVLMAPKKHAGTAAALTTEN
jgi:UDP-4-amino-4,6-dideoxy-N-acetyl-beta-L-altrosamine N-acetyltransferase